MGYAHVWSAGTRSHGLWHRLGVWSEKVWSAYWEHQARRATLHILHSLNDRTLKDIGMDRSEIESVVYTRAKERCVHLARRG